MSEHNKDLDVPIFDIEETGRVDLTLYKLDTGFMLRDNDTGADHSVKMGDLEASLDLVIEGIKTKLTSLMNDRQKFDFVDLAFIIQEGEAVDDNYALETPTQPSEVSLDPGQLAEIINEALDDSPLAGIPRRVGQRNVQVVDANMIMRALNSPKNVIKMRTRVRKEKSDKTSNLPLPKDKKRFHSDRTKNEHLKDNSGKGKENENKPNKIT